MIMTSPPMINQNLIHYCAVFRVTYILHFCIMLFVTLYIIVITKIFLILMVNSQLIKGVKFHFLLKYVANCIIYPYILCHLYRLPFVQL